MSQTRPEPPPEAALIRAAAKRNRISGRKAASLAGISDTRWRQIVAGYQSVGDSHHPVKAPADTLARMAQAVGATADELTAAGRADAAAELRELSTAPPAARSTAQVEAITALLATLPPEAQQEVLRRLQRGVSPADTHTSATERRAS